MANERRIVELVLKAVGDQQLKAITRDLAAMRKSADATNASLAGISGGLSKFGGMAAKALAGFGIVQTLQAVVNMAQRAIDEMDELSVTISKVGVAAGDLQKLQYAAALSNVGLDDLNKGLVKLSVNMTDLKGKGGFATDTLRQLGITAKTGTMDAMIKLADKFASMSDGAEKTALAVALFGKSGTELIPLLNSGSAGLTEMADEAERLGVVLSGEALAGANAFNDEIDRMTAAAEGAIKQLVGGMAPALVTIAQLLLGAAKSGTEFANVGLAIGNALVNLNKWLALAASYVNSFYKMVVAGQQAASAAIEGFRKSLVFDYQGAEAAFARAEAQGRQAADLWRWMDERALTAVAHVGALYEKNKAAIAEAGRLLDAGGTGTGGGIEAAAGGGGAGRKGGKSDAQRQAEQAQREADRAAAKAAADAQREIEDAFDKTMAAMKASREELAAYTVELNRAADPALAYAEGLARVDEAQATGKLTAEAYRVEVERLALAYDQQTRALNENSEAERARVEAQEKQKKALEELQQKWGFVADAMSQATYDMISGAESVGQAIRKMAATVISELLRMALVAAANKIFGAMLRSAGVPLFSAAGNAFGAGGVISTPTAHGYAGGGVGVLGEAGPEAIMPLQRTASGKLGVAAAGGGLNVIVNNNFAAAQIGVRQTDQGLQIDVIERQLAERVRRGGTSLPGALENTYRNGRYASAY